MFDLTVNPNSLDDGHNVKTSGMPLSIAHHVYCTWIKGVSLVIILFFDHQS